VIVVTGSLSSAYQQRAAIPPAVGGGHGHEYANVIFAAIVELLTVRLPERPLQMPPP